MHLQTYLAHAFPVVSIPHRKPFSILVSGDGLATCIVWNAPLTTSLDIFKDLSTCKSEDFYQDWGVVVIDFL